MDNKGQQSRTIMDNNGQQWTIMDNNGQQRTPIHYRFFYYHIISYSKPVLHCSGQQQTWLGVWHLEKEEKMAEDEILVTQSDVTRRKLQQNFLLFFLLQKQPICFICVYGIKAILHKIMFVQMVQRCQWIVQVVSEKYKYKYWQIQILTNTNTKGWKWEQLLRCPPRAAGW